MDLKKAKKDWENISNDYYNRFIENKDPNIINDFIKRYSVALKEKWVIGQVQEWGLHGNFDALKKAVQFRKGERKEDGRFKIAHRNLLIFNEVKELHEQGMGITGAIARVAENLNMGAKTISRIYYKMKDHNPEVFILEDENNMHIHVVGTKLEMGPEETTLKLFGTWTYTISK